MLYNVSASMASVYRFPGELLGEHFNFLIVFTGIIPQLVKHSPNTVLMIVSNPGNNGVDIVHIDTKLYAFGKFHTR